MMAMTAYPVRSSSQAPNLNDTTAPHPSRLLACKRGTIVAVIWIWVVVAVVVIGAVAVLVAGRDDEMAEVYDDRPDVPFPTGRPLAAADLDQLRFSTGFRGYRMDEVDAFVARIKAELIGRESPSTEHSTAPASDPDESDARTQHDDEETQHDAEEPAEDAVRRIPDDPETSGDAAGPATPDRVEAPEAASQPDGDDTTAEHGRHRS
jgi:DivIVA domain-containing protein